MSLAALAQHYGLPTRLLDWTRQPFIAAYFAAEGVYQHLDTVDITSRIVVWAFHFPLFGKHDNALNSHHPIRIVTAPSASNPNLKAQQGVFTLLHWDYTNEQSELYRPMEQVIAAIENDPRSGYVESKRLEDCKMRKFTLLASEAVPLLHLLSK